MLEERKNNGSSYSIRVKPLAQGNAAADDGIVVVIEVSTAIQGMIHRQTAAVK